MESCGAKRAEISLTEFSGVWAYTPKIVFVGMARLFGKTVFDNAAVASEVLGVPAPRSTVTSHRYHLTLTTGETLVVNSATSIDDALSKAAVHPANLVTHYTDAE